jgi:hypothetical protein
VDGVPFGARLSGGRSHLNTLVVPGSVLAEKSGRIARLFPREGGEGANQHAGRGAHLVRLFQCGAPQDVIVDDFFPCRASDVSPRLEQPRVGGHQKGVSILIHQQFETEGWGMVSKGSLAFPDLCGQGHPLAAHSKTNEMWPLLAEKAYAKLHGSYQRIQSGSATQKVTHVVRRHITRGGCDICGPVVSWLWLVITYSCMRLTDHPEDSVCACAHDSISHQRKATQGEIRCIGSGVGIRRSTLSRSRNVVYACLWLWQDRGRGARGSYRSAVHFPQDHQQERRRGLGAHHGSDRVSQGRVLIVLNPQ